MGDGGARAEHRGILDPMRLYRLVWVDRAPRRMNICVAMITALWCATIVATAA
jgi:hypothetical protein